MPGKAQVPVERYLSAFDVFVLPSRFEGFPLSVIEARASRPGAKSWWPASASAKAQPRPSPLLAAQTRALRPEMPRSN